MSDMQFDAYLNLLTRFLRLSPRQREEIRRELRAHLEEAIEAELARGRTREEAITRILDDFGDAAELAARFSVLSNRKRWIMRGTLAAACLGFATFTLHAIWPEGATPVVAENSGAPRAGEVAVGGAQPRADGITTDDAQIAKRLSAPIEANFQDTPLSDVLEYFREIVQTNVFVQRRQLEDHGVALDTPVTLQTTGLPADRTLRLVLDAVGTDVPLGFVVDQGVLLIGPEEKLPRRVMTNVYAVQDLLEASDGTSLVQLIINSVSPDSWRDNGGQYAITNFDTTLVVRTTRDVHAEVERLLTQLRSARAAGSPTGAVPYKAPPRARIQKALEIELPELVFDQQPLEAILQVLTDFTKIEIVVDWDELKRAGVTRDRGISYSSRNRPFSEVLTDLLRAAAPNRPVLYSVEAGGIRICSPEVSIVQAR